MLGVAQRSVAWMMIREIVVAVGGIAGAAGAIALGRFVESLTFGLAPRDPVTLAASAALLLVICLLARYLTARRAARIDPIVAR
jgi:putative ABC transport system permease protein